MKNKIILILLFIFSCIYSQNYIRKGSRNAYVLINNDSLLVLGKGMGQPPSDYYLSTSGSDANTGASEAQAWKSLTKLQTEITAGTLDGKSIALNKGNKWRGVLDITSHDSIAFSSYGTGNRPIITGLDTISGWTDHGGNIWYADVEGTPDIVRFLYIDGINVLKGTYPNNHGWINIDSVSGLNTIYSESLGQTDGYFAGASVVTPTSNEWAIFNGNISTYTALTGKIVTSNSATYSLDSTNKFFLIDDTTLLDIQNEWSYDENNYKIYLYSTVDPNTYEVTYSSNSEDLIALDGSNGGSFNGIAFKGSNEDLIFVDQSDTIVINNCVFEDSYRPIYVEYSYNITFSNNTVDNSVGTGIRFGRAINSVINNNTITNTADEYYSFEDGAFGDNGKTIDLTWVYDGVLEENVSCDSVLIYNNLINQAGYSGIHVTQANNSHIYNNRVNQPNIIKQDGGAIYTWMTDTLSIHGGYGSDDLYGLGVYKGTWIRNNYVYFNHDSNAFALDPENNDSIYGAYGIYCDDNSMLMHVDSNMAVGYRLDIYMHGAALSDMSYNILVADSMTKRTVYYNDRNNNGRYLTLDNNILTAWYSGDPNPAWTFDQLNYDLSEETFTDNHYLMFTPQHSGFGANDIIYNTQGYTLEEWQAYEYGEPEAVGRPFTYEQSALTQEDSLFAYEWNYSASPVNYSIADWGSNYYYYDKDGSDYTDSTVSVDPYYGMILFRSKNNLMPPDTALIFTVTSPNRDSITLQISKFDTDVDSVRINYDLGGYPTSRTDGTLFSAFGTSDTSSYADTTFYIDAPSDTAYYFTAWHGNIIDVWNEESNQDTVNVDSTGVYIETLMEDWFADSNLWAHETTYWIFDYGVTDSVGIYLDVSTYAIVYTVNLPANTDVKITFEITEANSTARLGFFDNSDVAIVTYDNYAVGTHEVYGTTDGNGGTALRLYGSSSSPDRWKISYIKIETQ